MQVQAHPQLPGTHVVLDVRQFPRLFRMLTELTCGCDSLEYSERLGGFVCRVSPGAPVSSCAAMTLEVPGGHHPMAAGGRTGPCGSA